MNVNDHINNICTKAGLGVMVEIFDVIQDREGLSDEILLSLDHEDVTNFYENYIGPAIDNIQDDLDADLYEGPDLFKSVLGVPV